MPYYLLQIGSTPLRLLPDDFDTYHRAAEALDMQLPPEVNLSIVRVRLVATGEERKTVWSRATQVL
jgi:hypothetical protein